MEAGKGEGPELDRNPRQQSKKPNRWAGLLLESLGSPTWARTRDLRINSPSLYRLSYRGIGEPRIIGMAPYHVKRESAKIPASPHAIRVLAPADDMRI